MKCTALISITFCLFTAFPAHPFITYTLGCVISLLLQWLALAPSLFPTPCALPCVLCEQLADSHHMPLGGRASLHPSTVSHLQTSRSFLYQRLKVTSDPLTAPPSFPSRHGIHLQFNVMILLDPPFFS